MDNYWKICYSCIRKYYPKNKIIIIDDNSKKEFLDEEYEKNLTNTLIINSEYPGRGELLPYIYYLKNNIFDIAVILHDSVFINKKFNLDVNDYKKLWWFPNNIDLNCHHKSILKFISKLDNSNDLLNIYQNKTNWKGCFGGMTIITYDYLNKINNKYNLKKLLPFIKKRFSRQTFERILGLLLNIDDNPNNNLLGNIINYTDFGRVKFDNYEKNNKYNKLPLIKIWTGR